MLEAHTAVEAVQRCPHEEGSAWSGIHQRSNNVTTDELGGDCGPAVCDCRPLPRLVAPRMIGKWRRNRDSQRLHDAP